jgi:hypothetical protein
MLEFLADSDAEDEHVVSGAGTNSNIENTTAIDTSQEQLDKEMASYTLLPVADKKYDLLVFWKQHASTYPNLAAISRRVHAIPATSVPCERLFSTAGVIVSDLRSSLLPDTVSKLMFLNKN